MIGDLIISAGLWVLVTIIGWFPISTGFPSEVLEAATALGGYLDLFSPIVPTDTLLLVIPLAFSAEIAIFGFKTLKWFISFFRS